MNREEVIEQTKRIILSLRTQDRYTVFGAHAEASEFLRIYAGPNSSFYQAIQQYNPATYGGATRATLSVLQSFLGYVEAGLHQSIPPERQAQLDVVSDFLEMANSFLDMRDVHPASAAVLIGATLEEFLRNWVEAEGLALGNRNPSLENYSQILREANLITKQDGKDITAWAGIRNHAAHGEWDEVADKNRIRLMLENVNLFIRKYTK